MPRLNYSIRAQADIERLFQFLAKKDASVALRAIGEIYDSLTTLNQLPEMGRPVEDGLRELIIEFGKSGYVALYDFDVMLDEVVIYAIKHQLEEDYL